MSAQQHTHTKKKNSVFSLYDGPMRKHTFLNQWECFKLKKMIFWSYCLYKTIKSAKLIIHSFYHDLWVTTSYYELLRVSSNFSYNGFCADCQLYCLQRNCSSKAAGHPMWRMFALESSNMHRYVSYVSMLLLFLIFQVTTYLLIKHFYLRIFFSFHRNNAGRVPSSSSGWR